jgi:predicted nuclease of restriction endonuclease-like RecB superfamily
VIAMQPDQVSEVRLFDHGDMPWIEQLLQLVERSLGEPWRVLLERIEHAPLSNGARPVPPKMREQITNALRRVLGGRAERGRIARKLRGSVLGHPALAPAEREARIAAAADSLGIAREDVESLLWADLARERPVVLPGGRPDPRMLAAIANVDRIQREMRRARMIELRVWDNAHGLVRLAARCGLITQVSRESDGALLLRITGPLALFHATTVYGRALGALVPLLVEHPRFELEIHCDYTSGPHTRQVVPPVLLPPYNGRLKPSPAERLVVDLARRGHTVDPAPEPLTVDRHVVVPDLAIEHAGVRWFVEVIGFSTADYLADKRALYRAANERVLFCVDAKRSNADEQADVVSFTRRIDADDVVQVLEEAT